MLPRGFCLKIVAADSKDCEFCDKKNFRPVTVDPYINCCETCMKDFAPTLLESCQELLLKRNQTQEMN